MCLPSLARGLHNALLKTPLSFRTQAEPQRQFAALPTTRERALFLSTYRHGLYTSEAGLRQKTNVDLKRGRITIPKSGKSKRVDLSLQLAETLKALLVERKKETLRKGWGEVPEWVFTNEEGKPLDQSNFHYRVWRKLLAKAGLRYIRVHDLRHTFASLLIQSGESLAYVKEQLGHYSIQITVDTYGHLVPGGNRQAVDRLDDPQDTLPSTTIRNLSATTPLDAVLPSRVSAGKIR